MTDKVTFDKLMSTVIYREETDAIYVSDYYKTLTEYFDNSVYEYTGLTIDDYFNLTDEVAEDVIHMINIRIKLKSETLDKLQEQYGNNKPNNNDVDTFDDITGMYRV